MKRKAPFFPLRWTLRPASSSARLPGAEIPAQVPGDVFSDLLEAGLIPDPYFGLNSRQVQWVSRCDWLYQGRTELAPRPGQRWWLEFAGLDYRWQISWNARQLKRGEGMFSRVLLEVEPHEGENTAAILFRGWRDRWFEHFLPPLILNTEPVRRRVLKSGMSFGWDFAPRLKTIGIWDEAGLFSTGPVMIEDLCLRPKNDGRVEITLVLESASPLAAEAEFIVSGESFAGDIGQEIVPLRLQPGRNEIFHLFHVDTPRLWWPWDLGSPELYRLDVRLMAAGECSDAVTETFGFRDLSWGRNPGSPPGVLDWTLLINGEREFLRGANFVPAEALPGRLSAERYVQLLHLARQANLNSLRVWGGGSRQRNIFYETCDRLGLLVWQEFPLACLNFGAPRSGRWLSLLRQETGEIVRQLRNHPAVIMWCGGNEFNVRLSRPAVRVMAEVCRQQDPERRFVPASPFRGDSHNWIVWHLKGNLTDYFHDPSQLISEFGLQAAPAVESLEQFLPADELWPPGAGWRHHHLSAAKMAKYVKHFRSGEGLAGFVQASQRTQGHYLRHAIEYWRRNKYQKSGVLFWQWNDCWPAVSWSVVDYYLRPKRAYEEVRQACQPLLPTAEFELKPWQPGEQFFFTLWLVNDLRRGFPSLEIEIRVGEKVIQRLPATVGPDEVRPLGSFSFVLPADTPPRLILQAREEETLLAENIYDLRWHDPERAGLLWRRLFRRYWQFLTE